MDLSEYCRDIEAYLCRKNDGHLIRIVGPSFEIVSRWAAEGVPLKVAMGGIDRYFERYYRKGPRRRPVKIDFCEADVLDLFDEWRRATGVTSGVRADAAANGDSSGGEAVPPEEASGRRRGPSLREHLERVLIRLSSLRATGALSEAADPLLDSVSAALDEARARGGLRGEARTALVERLGQMDAQFMTLLMASMAPSLLADIEREATDELAPFRQTMEAEAYARAAQRATIKAVRDRLRLPIISFA